MTRSEASERYQIPMQILQEYESWGLSGTVRKVLGSWQYDDTDLERLSTIMTLRDIGFAMEEVELYMRLLEKTRTEEQRLRMLEAKRTAALDEIHLKERQLQRLDGLRHEIRKAQDKAGGRNA